MLEKIKKNIDVLEVNAMFFLVGTLFVVKLMFLGGVLLEINSPIWYNQGKVNILPFLFWGVYGRLF